MKVMDQPELMHEGLGDALVECAKNTQCEVILVAPFIKLDALARLVRFMGDEVHLTVVTRWNADEIVSGVSDLAVWDIMNARLNARLCLLPRLHAKYFRFDNIAFIGSANITLRALGWSTLSNLEVMMAVDVNTVSNFEEAVLRSSFEVNQEVVDAMWVAVKSLGAMESTNISEVSLVGVEEWFPQLMHVHHLFNCYQGKDDLVITSAFLDGQEDLKYLRVPQGLTEVKFSQFVAARLQGLSVVALVDSHTKVALDRTMGMHLLIRERFANEINAAEKWDTISAWLIKYFPKRYRIKHTTTGPALEKSHLVKS